MTEEHEGAGCHGAATMPRWGGGHPGRPTGRITPSLATPSARVTPSLAVPAALLLLAATVAACAGTRRGADEPPAHTVAFLFDRSSSVEPRLLLAARELTRRRLRTLAPGDRLMVWAVDDDGDPDTRSWRVPEGWPRNVGSDFLEEVRERVVSVTDTSPGSRDPGTELLTSMEKLAEEMERHPGAQNVAYVFSDMLQVGSRLNFEAPDFEAPRTWLSEKAARGDLPDLRGLCVVVVGPRGDTVRDRNVRAFWQAYFRAAGAELAPENYTPRMSRLPEDPCPSLPGPAERR